MSSQKELSCPLGKEKCLGTVWKLKEKLSSIAGVQQQVAMTETRGFPPLPPFILSAQGRIGRFWDKSVSEVGNVFSRAQKK